jgi:hypothetical protein
MAHNLIIARFPSWMVAVYWLAILQRATPRAAHMINSRYPFYETAPNHCRRVPMTSEDYGAQSVVQERAMWNASSSAVIVLS